MTRKRSRWFHGAWICAALACAAPGKNSVAAAARPDSPAAAEAKSSAAISGAEVKPPEKPVSPAVAGGAALFMTKGCVMCHGENAKGGVRNRYSQSEFIPALELVADGYTPDELKQKIRKGVPLVAKADPNGPVPILVMPSWEDKLTPEELDSIVAYLLSLAPKGGGKDDF